MYRMLCLIVAAMSVAFASLPTSASAQIAATQIKLTEKQIEGFIAAQDDMLAVVGKMQDAISSEYEAALDAVTKKYGFKGLAEYDAVATNISIVTAAINPQTRVFTDPHRAIKREIADVSADKEISKSEKKLLLEELYAAFQAAKSIQFPTNIKLVKKYYDKLKVLSVGTFDDDNRSTWSVMRASGD